jgi:hypothetical protein
MYGQRTGQWTGKTSIPTNVYWQVDGWTGKIGKGGMGSFERESVAAMERRCCALFTLTRFTLDAPRPQRDGSWDG